FGLWTSTRTTCESPILVSAGRRWWSGPSRPPPAATPVPPNTHDTIEQRPVANDTAAESWRSHDDLARTDHLPSPDREDPRSRATHRRGGHGPRITDQSHRFPRRTHGLRSLPHRRPLRRCRDLPRNGRSPRARG